MGVTIGVACYACLSALVVTLAMVNGEHKQGNGSPAALVCAWLFGLVIWPFYVLIVGTIATCKGDL